MAITLTQEQLNTINDSYINNPNLDKPNYAGMYQYIFEQVGSQMSTEQGYWFQRAAIINNYLTHLAHVPPEPSSYFIQQIKAVRRISDRVMRRM